MLGFFLSIFILIFLVFILISSLVNSATEDRFELDAQSVLKIELNEELHDRASKNPFENFNFSAFKTRHQLGLNEILKDIKKASSDEDIKGIYLELGSIPAGIACIEEIRDALIDFKKSKKFILSYSEYYSQKAYYLASVSDAIYLNPAGSMDWKGLSSQLMFFKGTLEKLEVEPEIIRHGKFKSAVEPFILDKMSDESRLQTKTFISGIWNHWIDNIALQRKISASTLNQLANDLTINHATDAVEANLIDKALYYDEVQSEIKKRIGISTQDKISFVSLSKYHKVAGPSRDKLSMDKIAIVFAEGDIESGDGEESSIGSDRIASALREARLDKKVKAIVLRVNSPGGSALASDVIWRECLLAKQAKPLVVSMGNYAASGGYYISCVADKIVAGPTTLTGSIGVFGLLLNTQKLLNNKLGISIDTVNSNTYADFGSTVRPLSAEERAFLQQSVERVYDEFISKVAAGRKISKAQVDSIGQGRVWCGKDALKLGLVDELGGLNKAIEIAADLAKINQYRLYNLPQQKDAIEQVMRDITGDAELKFMKSEWGSTLVYLEKIRSLARANRSIQARMEFSIELY